MFKNLTIYRAAWPADLQLSDLRDALQANAFVPCGALQTQSTGCVPPREERGEFVEAVGGEWIAACVFETKTVPGALLRKKTQEAVDKIHETTGRVPGKKETAALREAALDALLPNAHPRQARVLVWIDRANNRVLVDTVSQAQLDKVVTLLVRAMPWLQLTELNTQITPATGMTGWLLASDDGYEWPRGLSVERECELKSGAEDKAVVRYSRCNLMTEEVRRRLEQGMRPTRLAMSWEGRVAFTLTENLTLRKVTLLATDERSDQHEKASGFDADVAIATGELKLLLPDLVAALGGELLPGQMPGEAQGAQT